MKKSLLVFIFFIAVFFIHPFEPRGEELKLSIYHYPPYVIVAKKDNQICGIDVDVVREIAKRMNLDVTFYRCPWRRCLKSMEVGTVDVLTNAVKKPDREKYMLYCDKPFLTDFPIVFYFKKGKGSVVKTYEDLYKYTIGYERGAVYFDRFDNDRKMSKVPWHTYDKLLNLLNEERIDGVIGYKDSLNYIISEMGLQGAFEETSYRYAVSHNESFITVSKKSPLASRFAEFNRIHDQLLKERIVDKIKKGYFEKYSSE
jgi:polar amino acid transport system substrate-binding protein